jgi:hypothetical protein
LVLLEKWIASFRLCPLTAEIRVFRAFWPMHTLGAMAAIVMNVTATKQTDVSIKRIRSALLPNSTGAPFPLWCACLFSVEAVRLMQGPSREGRPF